MKEEEDAAAWRGSANPDKDNAASISSTDKQLGHVLFKTKLSKASSSHNQRKAREVLSRVWVNISHDQLEATTKSSDLVGSNCQPLQRDLSTRYNLSHLRRITFIIRSALAPM